MYSVVDLFAGCGGMTKGFIDAGFKILGAFENWPIAANCYAENFDHPVFLEDLNNIISSVNNIKKLNADIIIGGPPCQDFSHAGKRIESDKASLTESFAHIISEVNPNWFVMENVERVQKSATYTSARKIFKAAGYGLTEIVLNASLCNVPQKRKRFFCIGSKKQNDGFMDSYFKDNVSDKEMTLRDYFGNALDFEFYYRHPRNYDRRGVFSIDEPAPTIRGVNRPLPKGYPGHPNDASRNRENIRALTTLERALIQTFPADFRWCGSKTDTEQMIGNAVPVKLAEFVANGLKEHIILYGNEFQFDHDDFHEWLKKSCSFTKRVEQDVISRLRRANSICKIVQEPGEYYFFQLEQSEQYKKLTSTVRSQLKRAVTLYQNYCQTS